MNRKNWPWPIVDTGQTPSSLRLVRFGLIANKCKAGMCVCVWERENYDQRSLPLNHLYVRIELDSPLVIKSRQRVTFWERERVLSGLCLERRVTRSSWPLEMVAAGNLVAHSTHSNQMKCCNHIRKPHSRSSRVGSNWIESNGHWQVNYIGRP